MDNLRTKDTGRGTNRYLLMCSVFTASEIRTTSNLWTADNPELLAIPNHLRERTAMPKSFCKAWHWPEFSSMTTFRRSFFASITTARLASSLASAIYCKLRPQSSPLRCVASYRNLQDADNLSTADELLAPNVSVIQTFTVSLNVSKLHCGTVFSPLMNWLN